MFPITAVLDVGMRLLDKFFPDPEQKAKAQIELLRMQQNGELAQINADIAEQQELTKRQQADMSSDSWLAKNIRPVMLIALVSSYLIFAVASIFDYDTKTAYVELLGQWGMLAFSFYFGSRGMEKIADIWAKNKNDSK